MKLTKKQIQEIVDYWKQGAERNFETAKFLYQGKRYSDCLFFCHLCLEKLLKGLIVKQAQEHAPYIHELDTLAEKISLNFNEQQINELKIISAFNIGTRYDNIKFVFYKKCTKEYTAKYFNISKNLYLWLKKQYQKK